MINIIDSTQNQESQKLRLGFALCGSFCTFDKAVAQLEKMARIYDVYPILSRYAFETDTRFGKAADWIARMEAAVGRPVISTIDGAEPIGPKNFLDVLVVAPCTGNTLGKLAAGITDTPVTMAVKAHLRNNKPVVLGVSTNDALGASARGIGLLLNTKNIYFIPMRQDDPGKKPRSVVADFDLLEDAVFHAMSGIQLEPILL